MTTEEVQHPHAPRHLNPRLDLHRGPHITGPINEGGTEAQGEGLDGEGGGHVLSPAGGNEHEADLSAVVEKLERAVVVRERASVRVPNGGVL